MTWIYSVLDWHPCLVCPEHGYDHLSDYYYYFADDTLMNTCLGSLNSVPSHFIKDVIMYFGHQLLF
jgi:hypothetical protein